jgi:lysylphosphatidylglycerol synthetase-like protein (DUF2156 family)
MEQTTQQISQKPSLPIKTKIVAWWITIIGGIALIVSIYLLIRFDWIHSDFDRRWLLFFITPLIVVTVTLLIPGIMILYLKKRSGWWLATISLSIWTILIVGYGVLYVISNLTNLSLSGLILFPLITTLIAIIPLVLLLQDRENFFKIAS